MPLFEKHKQSLKNSSKHPFEKHKEMKEEKRRQTHEATGQSQPQRERIEAAAAALLLRVRRLSLPPNLWESCTVEGQTHPEKKAVDNNHILYTYKFIEKKKK